jgi:hypothetical protein
MTSGEVALVTTSSVLKIAYVRDGCIHSSIIAVPGQPSRDI